MSVQWEKDSSIITASFHSSAYFARSLQLNKITFANAQMLLV